MEPVTATEKPPFNQTTLGRDLSVHFLKKYSKPLFLGVFSLALTDILDVLPPLLIKAAIDSIEKGRGFSTLSYLALIYALAAIGQAAFRFLWRSYILGTSHTIGYDLRQRLFAHIQTLSHHFFQKMKTGEIMSRVTNDVDEVRQMFGIGFLLALDSLFYFCTVPLILVWMSPTLALYLLLPLPIIPFFVMKMGRTIRRRSREVQAKLAALSAKTQENFSGIRIIKSFGQEEAEISSFNAISREFVRENLDLAKIEAGFHPALELVMGVGIFFLLLIGSRHVLNGEISLGSFVAFQAYLLKLVWPMTALGLTINIHQRGMASLVRCGEILLAEPETRDSPPPAAGDPAGPLPPPLNQVGFRIRNLTYAYPDMTIPALKDVSLDIPPGKTAAIVGPIGCGKSTIIHLLLRILDAPPGTIFLDDRELKSHPLRELRDRIGFVPQDAFLFSESIRENLLFGLKEKNDLQKVHDCIKLAQVLPDIEAFPEKMETVLGERGVNLSGGQKQRVTLARALVRDPQILILDDALSAVDTDTESRILDGLKTFMKNRTTLMISHRISSVQHADQIYFLDQGSVVEKGTHQDLLAQEGRYYHMWKKQALESELEGNPAT